MGNDTPNSCSSSRYFGFSATTIRSRCWCSTCIVLPYTNPLGPALRFDASACSSVGRGPTGGSRLSVLVDSCNFTLAMSISWDCPYGLISALTPRLATSYLFLQTTSSSTRSRLLRSSWQYTPRLVIVRGLTAKRDDSTREEGKARR